jgi:hypothetical protein
MTACRNTRNTCGSGAQLTRTIVSVNATISSVISQIPPSAPPRLPAQRLGARLIRSARRLRSKLRISVSACSKAARSASVTACGKATTRSMPRFMRGCAVIVARRISASTAASVGSASIGRTWITSIAACWKTTSASANRVTTGMTWSAGYSRASTAALVVALLLAGSPNAHAAVSVSSIGVVGSTVTVTTATAHGLTVNTGFCLSAPASVCAVVKTVINSGSFAFDQPTNTTVSPCASSCGTGDLAPKVVVLPVSASQSTKTFSYLLWLTTLTPLPNAGATSAWTATATSAGASNAQNNALAAGSFLEVRKSVTFPASAAIGDVQTYMQNDYTSSQSSLAGNTQPGAFYGFVWNGSAWVQQ